MKKGKANLAKEKDKKQATKKLAFQEFQKYSQYKGLGKYNRQKRNPNQTNNLKPPEFPESIVGLILNKIISYVIYQTTVKEVYTHMDEKCFNYLKHLITPFLSTEYMYYEDGVEDIKHQKKKFYFKAPIPKRVNTWVNLDEPETPDIDRYASSTTKIIPCKTDSNDNNKENILTDVNKQESKDLKTLRRKSTVVDENLIVNETEEYSKRTKSIRMASIRSMSSQANNLNKINKVANNEKNVKNEVLELRRKKLLEKLKKEEEQKILELTWVDLPKEKYENKYIMKNSNEENNILRKERETLIIKQAEIKALKEIQEKKEKLKRFQNRLQINLDGSKQTFDPNGNILNIHPPQVENFNNEFCFVKVKNIESKNPNLERRKSSVILTRNTLLKKKTINNTRNTFKKLKTIKNKVPMSDETKEIFKYIRNYLLPKWQHRPVKKEFYEDDEGEEENEENQKKFFANKSFKQFFGPFLRNYIFKVDVEHNPKDRIDLYGYYKYDMAKKKNILPSGPNFRIIKPEVGVVVENKNNEKRKEIKDGGFEFIKKYNKPSMYEFSKLLMETSQINSSKVLSSGLIESKVNEINELNNLNKNSELNKEEYNYNGYMMEFSDMNNPLFQGALSLNDKNRILSSLSKKSQDNFDTISIIKGRNILKSMDEKLIRNKYNSVNAINMQNNSIQLTNKVKAPNLYSYFREILKEPEKNLESNEEEEDNNNNDINNDFSTLQKEKNQERNSSLPTIRVKRKEISRFNLNEMRKQMSGRKIINKFNYKIIKNKKWGEEDEKKKKEREMQNFGLDSGSVNKKENNDSNRIQLKKIGEYIINDDKYNIRARKAHLFRSSSAGNIF